MAINQSVLNKFLSAIGPLSYQNSVNVKDYLKDIKFLPIQKIDYKWTVSNPRIAIKPDKAIFMADVVVNSAGVNFPTTAQGVVEIKYDDASNIISVKVLKVAFEVAVTVFKQKIHITDVDISQFYRPEFQFSGPQPIQKSVDVKMPDNTVRTLYLTAKPRLTLEEGQLVVSTGVDFSFTKKP